jgi:hypothetical protein
LRRASVYAQPCRATVARLGTGKEAVNIGTVSIQFVTVHRVVGIVRSWIVPVLVLGFILRQLDTHHPIVQDDTCHYDIVDVIPVPHLNVLH